MKIQVLVVAVAMVMCAMHVQQSEAFLRNTFRGLRDRVRDVFRRPEWRALGCLACPRVCAVASSGLATPVCHVSCAAVCRRGKRDLRGLRDWFDGHVTPMANSWWAYDLDEDDSIDMDELATSTGDNSTSPGLIQAFRLADSNGDGLLTREEFYQGPFVFEMDLDEDDYTECLAVFSRYGRQLPGSTTMDTTQVPPSTTERTNEIVDE